MSFLDGKKTYIAAGFGIAIAIGAWLGVLPTGIADNVNPGNLLMDSIMFIFARLGISKVA